METYDDTGGGRREEEDLAWDIILLLRPLSGRRSFTVDSIWASGRAAEEEEDEDKQRARSGGFHI